MSLPRANDEQPVATPPPHQLEAVNKLRVIFAGTPAFAAIALEAILQSQHDVIAVYTQPDRPAGRGLKLTPSAVKLVAQRSALPLYQPHSLKGSAEQLELAHMKADVMVVAAYGMILPAAVLAIPSLGCINIHPSLLPRWRGAAPIQRTIHAGDAVTGVTIMQMDAGLDTGPILVQYPYILDGAETSQSLHDKLATEGARAIVDVLNTLSKEVISPRVQDDAHATYAHKITKAEAAIDWQQPAKKIEYAIRAFNPWPVAYTQWNNQALKIWQASAISDITSTAMQTVLAVSPAGIDVATGEGTLRLQSVQLPGGKVMSAYEFYLARTMQIMLGQLFV